MPVYTPKEPKDTGICLPCVGQAVHFFLKFSPSSWLYCRNNMEEKTYPAMDLLVYGEANATWQRSEL